MMTGAGTAEDPYIVDTIEDFRTAIATSCDYVKLNADLDCSDMDYWSGIITKAKIIDLCGHTIKNVNINSSTKRYFISPYTDSTTNCTIKNGTIQSLYSTNLDSVIYYNDNYYGDVNLTDLKISGEFVMSGTSTGLFHAGYISFTRCSINIKVNNLLPTFYEGNHYMANYNYCNIKLEADCKSRIFYGTPRHSKFTGKITNSQSYFNHIFSNGGSDNVIAVEFISATENSKFSFSSGTPEGYSVLDSELANQALWSEKREAYVKYLTTAQMKSAEYLNSIGFPVSEV